MPGGFPPHSPSLPHTPPRLALARPQNQNRHKQTLRKEGRFETETLHFHERVRRGYLRMARRESDRFLVVDAGGNPKRVHEAVWAALEKARVLPRRR